MSAIRRQPHRVRPTTLLTPPEREPIRREFTVRWNAARPLADGIGLKRWATGPTQGQVKVPVVVRPCGEFHRGQLVSVAHDDGRPSPT